MNSAAAGSASQPSSAGFWSATKRLTTKRPYSGIPNLATTVTTTSLNDVLVSTITAEVNARIAKERKALDAHHAQVLAERELVAEESRRVTRAVAHLQIHTDKLDNLQPQRNAYLELENRRHVAEVERLQRELERYTRLFSPDPASRPAWAHIVSAWGTELHELVKELSDTVGDDVHLLSNLAGSPNPKMLIGKLKSIERILTVLETFSEDCWAWADQTEAQIRVERNTAAVQPNA
jgi:DNA repair ATPase RecN